MNDIRKMNYVEEKGMVKIISKITKNSIPTMEKEDLK
jgi:hypothetical protein